MTAITIEITAVLLLFAANGVFALVEMAVVSSRRSRLRRLADSGDRRAAAALRLAECPERFLPTVQIGITVIGLLAGAVSGMTLAEETARGIAALWPSLARYAEAMAVGVVVTLLTTVSLIVGELVPKRWALSDPEGLACRFAVPVEWLGRLASPVVGVLGWATEMIIRCLRIVPRRVDLACRDEVSLLIREGQEAGVFHRAGSRMVESVLAFDRVTVAEIMTPRSDVVCLEAEGSGELAWRRIVVSGHSCYPVVEPALGRVVGVVAVKALYANVAAGVAARVRDLMTEPLRVAPTDTVMGVLERIRETGRHVALVCDGGGRLLGLVTPMDVLEAVVGEMPAREDRHRRSGRVTKRPQGTVGGGRAVGFSEAAL